MLVLAEKNSAHNSQDEAYKNHSFGPGYTLGVIVSLSFNSVFYCAWNYFINANCILTEAKLGFVMHHHAVPSSANLAGERPAKFSGTSLWVMPRHVTCLDTVTLLCFSLPRSAHISQRQSVDGMLKQKMKGAL